MEKLTIDEIIGHCERKTEQYERFYKREYFETTPLISSTIKEYWEHRQVAEYLKKLKDYENLEEQGRLIKLPCKVGDTVYAIGFNNNKPIIYESVVLSVLITEKEIAFNVKVDEFEINSQLKQSMFGKTVFLTKSEAEAKLKELGGGENE
jgi:hypothetical protein